MIKFSLIIPTRKRPRQLVSLVESLVEHTANINEIEIRFGVDNDDVKTQEALNLLKIKYPQHNFYIHKRNRGNSLVYHYINWLGSFCIGKYIFIVNDDCLWKCKNWDVLVYQRLENFLKDKPDGIVCGICQDIGYTPEEQSYLTTGFPIISKKAVDTLGFVLDPCFMDATSDDDICKLYATVGRTVDLRDILQIIHYPLGSTVFDENYQTLQEPWAIDKIERPKIPETVDEMRLFLDTRIVKLINKMLEAKK